ncbi:MAG: signal peptidase I [Polyangiaceae bacterium]
MSKILRFVVWTLIIGGALAGLLRLTVLRWWQVPLGDPYLEASLAPTLRGGDWILLWRGTAPIEGALVLCPDPKAAQRQVIGRIVGESSDHVQIVGDGVIVNRRPFENEGDCDAFSVRDPGTGQTVEQSCRREVVGSRTHLRGGGRGELTPPSNSELDVPGGQVFLLSDNRQFPWDSREFGTVARETCTETIVFRVISKDGFFDVANRFMLIR